jgi:hypothetical protein
VLRRENTGRRRASDEEEECMTKPDKTKNNLININLPAR